MTRKDYINIAAAILATQARIKNDHRIEDIDTERNQLRGVRRTAAHIADFLQDDNPAGFDPALFLTNCGYGVGPFVTKAASSEESAAKLDTPASEVWERD